MNFGWDDTIKPAAPPMTPLKSPENRRKRRFDDRRTSSSHSSPTYYSGSGQHHVFAHGVPKRAKSSQAVISSVPLRRRLEVLNKDALLQLIERLCKEHPGSEAVVQGLAPEITPEGAIEVLGRLAQRVNSSLPLGDDPKSDYAYLRVKPHLHEFFSCLMDYIPGFIPASPASLPQALEFLDGCTSLLHSLPRWRSSINNALLDRTYEQIANSWAVLIRQAPFAPDCEMRLLQHQTLSGGMMTAALDAAREVNTKPLATLSPAPTLATQWDFARAF